MTTTNFLASLLAKLVGIRVFVKNEVANPNQHPRPMMRAQLEGFLRLTQAEMLEALGEKSPKKLTVKLRKSIAVVARIHKGCDSYKTVAEKAEVLIKKLHPIYVTELERIKLEADKRAMRLSLEKRFHALSGGKALPDGTLSSTLEVIVGELRCELEETTRKKMDEVKDSAFFHPNISRVNDANLVAFSARLDERLNVLRRVRPVTQKPFTSHLAQRMVMH
ncbi:hypothetical protein IPH19_03165 [Candidatus Uhrbacteria bacterium]|nr:MAG: hypothetical protein IPH19_03165 [Candidatus Uhrbacteria bacterium]